MIDVKGFQELCTDCPNLLKKNNGNLQEEDITSVFYEVLRPLQSSSSHSFHGIDFQAFEETIGLLAWKKYPEEGLKTLL